MDRLRLTAATPAMGLELIAGMIEPDRRELLQVGRPEEIVPASIDRSSIAVASVGPAGDVVSIFGLAVSFSGPSRPWCLSTERLLEHRREFARRSKEIARYWMARHRLENYVAANHLASVRWLEWLGFALDDPAPFGPQGAMFRRFWSSPDV